MKGFQVECDPSMAIKTARLPPDSTMKPYRIAQLPSESIERQCAGEAIASRIVRKQPEPPIDIVCEDSHLRIVRFSLG